MKWLPLVLVISLTLCGCARPYGGRGYGASMAPRSRAGIAADAEPHDVQAALQKYLGTN